MLKRAAKFTDAFNFFSPFWKGDWQLAGRTLYRAVYQGQGLLLVGVNFLKLGFIAVLQLSLAYYSECHSNLLTLCFINKVSFLRLFF